MLSRTKYLLPIPSAGLKKTTNKTVESDSEHEERSRKCCKKTSGDCSSKRSVRSKQKASWKKQLSSLFKSKPKTDVQTTRHNVDSVHMDNQKDKRTEKDDIKHNAQEAIDKKHSSTKRTSTVSSPEKSNQERKKSGGSRHKIPKAVKGKSEGHGRSNTSKPSKLATRKLASHSRTEKRDKRNRLKKSPRKVAKFPRNDCDNARNEDDRQLNSNAKILKSENETPVMVDTPQFKKLPCISEKVEAFSFSSCSSPKEQVENIQEVTNAVTKEVSFSVELPDKITFHTPVQTPAKSKVVPARVSPIRQSPLTKEICCSPIVAPSSPVLNPLLVPNEYNSSNTVCSNPSDYRMSSSIIPMPKQQDVKAVENSGESPPRQDVNKVKNQHSAATPTTVEAIQDDTRIALNGDLRFCSIHPSNSETATASSSTQKIISSEAVAIPATNKDQAQENYFSSCTKESLSVHIPLQHQAPSGDQLKDRCLVLEVAYHGRTFNADEKAVIQSKVAKIVDALLKKTEISEPKQAAQSKIPVCKETAPQMIESPHFLLPSQRITHTTPPDNLSSDHKPLVQSHERDHMTRNSAATRKLLKDPDTLVNSPLLSDRARAILASNNNQLYKLAESEESRSTADGSSSKSESALESAYSLSDETLPPEQPSTCCYQSNFNPHSGYLQTPLLPKNRRTNLNDNQNAHPRISSPPADYRKQNYAALQQQMQRQERPPPKYSAPCFAPTTELTRTPATSAARYTNPRHQQYQQHRTHLKSSNQIQRAQIINSKQTIRALHPKLSGPLFGEKQKIISLDRGAQSDESDYSTMFSRSRDRSLSQLLCKEGNFDPPKEVDSNQQHRFNCHPNASPDSELSYSNLTLKTSESVKISPIVRRGNASETSQCSSTVTPRDSPNDVTFQWMQPQGYHENPNVFTEREHFSPRQIVQPIPVGTSAGNAFNQQCPYYYSFDSAASTDGVFVKKEHGTFTQKHGQLIHPRQCSPSPSKGSASVGDCGQFQSQTFSNQGAKLRRSAQADRRRFMRPYLHTDNLPSPRLPYGIDLRPSNYAQHQLCPGLYLPNQTPEAPYVGVVQPHNLHPTYYNAEAEELQHCYQRSPSSFQIRSTSDDFGDQACNYTNEMYRQTEDSVQEQTENLHCSTFDTCEKDSLSPSPVQNNDFTTQQSHFYCDTDGDYEVASPCVTTKSLSSSQPTPTVTSSSQKKQFAKWRRGTPEHEAWWMPKEWAKERKIGAFRSPWAFEQEEEVERRKDLELARNPNVEQIRTNNFIRL